MLQKLSFFLDTWVKLAEMFEQRQMSELALYMYEADDMVIFRGADWLGWYTCAIIL